MNIKIDVKGVEVGGEGTGRSPCLAAISLICAHQGYESIILLREFAIGPTCCPDGTKHNLYLRVTYTTLISEDCDLVVGAMIGASQDLRRGRSQTVDEILTNVGNLTAIESDLQGSGFWLECERGGQRYIELA